ncbi:MAG: hypothetical protein ACYDH6_18475 [Acidimicrobiales bacterium]
MTSRTARLLVGAGLLGSATLTVAMLATAAGPSGPPAVAVQGPSVAPVGVSSAGLSPVAEPTATP